MQRRRSAVDSDVGHVTAWPDETGARLEALRGADGLHHHIRAETVGQAVHDLCCLRRIGSQGGVGPHLLGRPASRFGRVDHDDPAR